MSGGSYNYLYVKDAGNIHEAYEELEWMVKRLAGLDYAKDAARETAEIVALIGKYNDDMNARLEKLSDVWKAVEWWDSGDWGEEHLKEALSEKVKT